MDLKSLQNECEAECAELVSMQRIRQTKTANYSFSIQEFSTFLFVSVLLYYVLRRSFVTYAIDSILLLLFILTSQVTQINL